MSVYVDIEKSYRAGFKLSVSFEAGGVTLGLLGASGSGKSLTLQCIAGLEKPDRGVIRINDRVLFDSSKGINLSPQERRVGYLFQNYALFPNMTVRENIAIAIDPRCLGAGKLVQASGSGASRKEIAALKEEMVMELIARYELDGLAERYPVNLSGGQQQRVALARIFAYNPEVLLLDEPFSALDSHLRETMQAELLNVIRGYDGDVILVTHSRDEAYILCDDLLVLDDGAITAEGSKEDVFTSPGSVTAARITGCKNIVRIEQTGGARVFLPDWGVRLKAAETIGEEHTHIGIRARRFSRVADGAKASADGNVICAEVLEVIEGPFEDTVILGLNGGKLWWITDRLDHDGCPINVQVGDVIELAVDSSDIHLLKGC